MSDLNIDYLLQAHVTLGEALTQVDSDLTRDGAIQRFEYTFELSWKLLKRFLKLRGVTVNSPKETFRQAAREGLIDDPLIWFQYLEHRNNTVHNYNAGMADAIFACIPDFHTDCAKLIEVLRSLL